MIDNFTKLKVLLIIIIFILSSIPSTSYNYIAAPQCYSISLVSKSRLVGKVGGWMDGWMGWRKRVHHDLGTCCFHLLMYFHWYVRFITSCAKWLLIRINTTVGRHVSDPHLS